MIAEHHFQIPDRIFFGLAGLVILLTAGFAIWAYPHLPAELPSHFGFNGRPDGYTNSRLFIVMFPLLLQLVIAGIVSWAYRHPKHINLPTRYRLESLAPPLQTAVTTLARHMMVIIFLIATLVMAHLSEGIVLTGMGLAGAPDPGILIFLMAFLLLAIIVYTGWMVRLIRRGTKDPALLKG